MLQPISKAFSTSATPLAAPAATRQRLLGRTHNAWGMGQQDVPTIGEIRRARRVLVIDDDVATAESLAVALECEGFDTAYACTSLSGIARADALLPDVIIVDANMPERHGFDTAMLIRHIVPNPDLVIIAFTAEHYAGIEDAALLSGCDGYCRKGRALDQLRTMIETLTS